MSINQQIEQAAQLISQAKKGVVMTGAGISTPSGIPDFRSPKSGLWDDVDPVSVASIYAFRHNPEVFYNWVRPLAKTLIEAKPNPAHFAVTQLEKLGYITAIVTQNIDDLHYKAGSKKVYELHGHLRELTCVRCYKTQPTNDILATFLEGDTIPQCQHCDGILKPNVILFGEQLPAREYVAAQQALKAADLILIIGSSLEVAPASDLPRLGLERGAKLILVNLQATYLDDEADVVIQADAAEVLPQIVELVKHSL